MRILTTEQQIEEVVRLKDEENLTHEQVAEKLGLSERTSRRRYKAGLLRRAADELSEDEELAEFPAVQKLDIDVQTPWIPENKGPIERFQPLVRTGDAMITCDFHIPLHDPILINKMIQCARENELKKLIIAGDYFNMETFSSFLPYQPEASLEQERYDGNYIMKALLKTFDEVDFLWGNHDFRLTRKLGFKKSFEECMRWMLSDLTEEELAAIRFTELDYMHYYPELQYKFITTTANPATRGREFRICHPRNFSSIPLTVPRSLAVKYNSSIITAHSHHHAIGVAANGHDLVIEGGGFFDKTRTEYIQKTNKNHEWVQGFVYFKEGIPYMVGPALGNDRRYQKEVVNT